MKLFFGLAALVSLTLGMSWRTDNETAYNADNSNVALSSRVAPPAHIRKIFDYISPYARDIFGKLLASYNQRPQIEYVGIMNAAPSAIVSQDQLVNPVAAPILNPGLAGVGTVPYFFPPVRINIDQSSQLYVPPGSDGRITVLLTNDGVGDFFLVSGGDDKGFFLQFDFVQIQIGPGQTVAVPGRIRVPAFANNVVSILTILVQRRTDNAISRRQVYIRTKSEPSERWAPWCTIRTVTRCDEYLNEAICSQRYWNMRAEIQDSEAGLLSIGIKPDGRFLGEDFPVGTNDSVAVEQSVSCCTTGVDITAIDVRGNRVLCRADQYTIYLQTGEIAAVVLGVLLLIVLLIIIIFVIYKCCKRRKTVKTAPLPPRSKKDQA